MKAEAFLNQNPVRYAGILEILRRGTACIIEDAEDGFYVVDSISHIGYLACKDTEKSYSWYCRHEQAGYPLLNIFDEKLKERMIRKSRLHLMMECHQYAYLSNKKPCIEMTLEMVEATLSDVPFIMSIYDTLEEWEIRTVIARHTLWLAKDGQNTVGIIGCHLEGSMGLLVVMEKYRRQGYAFQMESFLLSTLMERGCYCFTQVVKGNHASDELQRKIGMTMDDQMQYWLIHE